MTVGVRELKNGLTRYLRRAKQGEEIVVTERGRPVAVIQSIGSAGNLSSREARLARLAAEGLLTLPTGPRLKNIRAVRVKGRPLSKVILDERR